MENENITNQESPQEGTEPAEVIQQSSQTSVHQDLTSIEASQITQEEPVLPPTNDVEMPTVQSDPNPGATTFDDQPISSSQQEPSQAIEESKEESKQAEVESTHEQSKCSPLSNIADNDEIAGVNWDYVRVELLGKPEDKRGEVWQRRNRAFGCVFGAFIGDAAGTHVEFRSKKSISKTDLDNSMIMIGQGPFRVAPGQVTDDSEMAMGIVLGLTAGDKQRFKPSEYSDEQYNTTEQMNFDLQGIQEQFKLWAHDYYPFDMGGTTSNALHPLRKFNDKPKEQYEPHYSFTKVVHTNIDSQSNGCLMRITPLAVFTHKLASDEDLYTAVALQTMLTHSNKIAIDACYLYCFAIRALIQNADVREAFAATLGQAQPGNKLGIDQTVCEWLIQITQSSSQKPVADDRNIGHLKIAFVQAFSFLFDLGERIVDKKTLYENAIREVIQAGGDTDTNAAIVGGLIGAAVGLTNIPPEMIEKMITARTDLVNDSQGNRLQHIRQRPEYLVPALYLTQLTSKIFTLAPTELHFEEIPQKFTLDKKSQEFMLKFLPNYPLKAYIAHYINE